MQRLPEPELMDAPEQTQAYADADFSESNQSFVDAFVALSTDRDGTVIDLGCGPGDICIRLAHALPDWKVIGLDAGPNMLKLAAAAVKNADQNEQVELVLDQLPCAIPGSPTAIVSNSLLHHLPDPMSLWQTIADQAPSGCWVQVMDLHRPDSTERAKQLVETYAEGAPEVLVTDFYNSLLAAYTTDELAEQLAQSGLAQLQISRPSDRHWLVQGRIA
ncbi:MAG: methyltransferase domain-containing protein [Pseudomonadota bacterium]